MSRRRRSRTKRARGGFTLLEVMMAVAVMLVGVMGIISLERATLRVNSDARATSNATFNTSRWVGILHRVGSTWTDATTTSGIPYLENVGQGWFIPAAGDPDAYGLDWYGVPTAVAADVRFCTLVNIQWLTENTSVRADIITFWASQARGGGGGTAFANACNPSNGTATALLLNGDAPATTIVGTGLRMVRTTTVVRRAQP